MGKQTDQVYIEEKPWYKSKTFWTTVVDIVVTGGAIAMGETTFAIAIQGVFIPLILLWVRLGLNKKITWK